MSVSPGLHKGTGGRSITSNHVVLTTGRFGSKQLQFVSVTSSIQLNFIYKHLLQSRLSLGTLILCYDL